MDPYTHPPANKAELLARIDAEWQALHRAVQPLDERQMSVSDEGGWSIKDNLAHIAEWERYLALHHMRSVSTAEVWGFDAAEIAHIDEDGINQRLFERNRSRTKAEILTMLSESHKLVLIELGGWRFKELLKPRSSSGKENRSVGLLVAGNTYFHYQEHRKTIELLLRQVSGGNHG
jgi:hypothetical protein